jgi:hypothetical protein
MQLPRLARVHKTVSWVRTVTAWQIYGASEGNKIVPAGKKQRFVPPDQTQYISALPDLCAHLDDLNMSLSFYTLVKVQCRNADV